ncbi:hypothetical protein DACRYDRAFT_98101 [Dacryopinax primogenitus]|uniref:Uncharacterized protein n=1 Tax=Dacryopinax primogenitus (strain DJM 731) TaxID=1858805 RepID=M5GAB6_DACPD|nr:uncharacterized protein DACRYDRAFT_98101 [Dacryopinax primogenitus]EJU05280.1 hypothetical protein DACRYDRAFT_98101 [Dacryopinax primogenitus]
MASLPQSFKHCPSCGCWQPEGIPHCTTPGCGVANPAPPTPRRSPRAYPYGSPYPIASPYPGTPYTPPPAWTSPPYPGPPPSWSGSPYANSPALPIYPGRNGDLYECRNCGGQYATRWCGSCGRDLSNDAPYLPGPRPPALRGHVRSSPSPKRNPTPPASWNIENVPAPVLPSPRRRMNTRDLAYGPMPPMRMNASHRSSAWPPAPEPVMPDAVPEIPDSAYYQSRSSPTYRGPGSTPRRELREMPQPPPEPLGNKLKRQRNTVPVPVLEPSGRASPPPVERQHVRGSRRPEHDECFEEALAETNAGIASLEIYPPTVSVPVRYAIPPDSQSFTGSERSGRGTFPRLRSALRGKSPERSNRPKSPVRFAPTEYDQPEDWRACPRRSGRLSRRATASGLTNASAPIVEHDDGWEDAQLDEGEVEHSTSSFNHVPAAYQSSDDWVWTNPAFTLPIVPIKRLRAPFDDILDGDDTHKDHPAGKEALVHPSGGPTPKLQHFVEALCTWIWAKQPSDVPYITKRRLQFLEGTVRNSGITQIYKDDALEEVYQAFGLEYAKSNDEPMLTFKGFLRYVDLWILCEPRFVCLQLRALVRHVGFPPPMTEWQDREWLFDSWMTISQSHPDADTWRRTLHQYMLAGSKVIEGRGDAPLWATA